MENVMFDGWTSVLRTFILGGLAYVTLIVMLRTSGKRTLSKMNAFDFIVTVALGSTLATTLLSKDASLAGSHGLRCADRASVRRDRPAYGPAGCAGPWSASPASFSTGASIWRQRCVRRALPGRKSWHRSMACFLERLKVGDSLLLLSSQRLTRALLPGVACWWCKRASPFA